MKTILGLLILPIIGFIGLFIVYFIAELIGPKMMDSLSLIFTLGMGALFIGGILWFAGKEIVETVNDYYKKA